jgi:hypothetical protein
MQVLKLPRIRALDLRALEVQVAEHNARNEFQLRVWYPHKFKEAVLAHAPREK